MVYRPIQTRHPSGPSERTRSLISKATLAVIAIALLYAGYRCIAFSRAAVQEAKERAGNRPLTRGERRLTGAGLPLAVGVGLCGLGTIAAAGAVLPWSFFDRFVRPPSSERY
jgi:hypothetical protein